MEITFINICKIYKQFKWVFGFYYHGPYGGVIWPLVSFRNLLLLCVCVCVYRVKPLNVGITKIMDPKVGAKGVFFCFWVISSLRAIS
jgi:hypothetical protein